VSLNVQEREAAAVLHVVSCSCCCYREDNSAESACSHSHNHARSFWVWLPELKPGDFTSSSTALQHPTQSMQQHRRATVAYHATSAPSRRQRKR
jgi:hypothetical protein